MWPSVVVHEHWPVSQRMNVEMGDYAWSEHIVTVFLARARVWGQRNTSFQDNPILGTTAFGGGGVTVWGCFSFDCKLDLYVLDGEASDYSACANMAYKR
jgi:hypothetical protein